MTQTTLSPRSYRAAFTLLELLVVIAILALLAALAIPKITDLFERSRASTQAYSIADVSRQLETFSALNRKYPDGWDSLLIGDDNDELSLYGTHPSQSNNRLTPELLTLLAPAPLTLADNQRTALSNAGMSHIFLHDATLAANLASDSGVDRRHYGTGTGHDGTANISSAVVIDKTPGSAGLNLLINSFGLNPNRSAGDTVLPRISANEYVVLGLGPRSTLVQTQLHEAPLLEHATSASRYSRALAVFEIPTEASGLTIRARLVGVLSPDGRSKRMAIADYNSMTVPH